MLFDGNKNVFLEFAKYLMNELHKITVINSSIDIFIDDWWCKINEFKFKC